MLALNRWSPFEEMFNFQREMDRLFNRFWSDVPARGGANVNASNSIANTFNVASNDDGWRIEVPLPGIDPQHVTLDIAGNELSIRAERPAEEKGGSPMRYEQTFTLPQFLDVERISATHRHGLLQISAPFKEAVKPRRIAIDTTADQKRLNAA